MDGEEDKGQESKLLSPEQITEIDETFNKLFNNAKREGILRDAKTYRSFDDIFEISMRLHRREHVSDEELYRPVAVRVSLEKVNAESKIVQRQSQRKDSIGLVEPEPFEGEPMNIDEDTVIQEGIVEQTTKTVRIETTSNAVVTDNDFAFSDEESPPLRPTKVAKRPKMATPEAKTDKPSSNKRRRSEGVPAPPIEPGRTRPFWGNRFTGPLFPEHTHSIYPPCALRLTSRMEKRTTTESIGIADSGTPH